MRTDWRILQPSKENLLLWNFKFLCILVPDMVLPAHSIPDPVRYPDPKEGTFDLIDRFIQDHSVCKSLLRISVFWLRTVLRNADPGCLSRIRLFSIPDPVSKRFLDTGSAFASKNFCILTQKLFLSSRKYYPGCSSRIRDHGFYPFRIPNPGVKKAPDYGLRIPYPGSDYATLITNLPTWFSNF